MARVYFHGKQKGENNLGTKKADIISWNKNQTKLENSLPSNSKYSQTSMSDYPSYGSCKRPPPTEKRPPA